MNIANWTVQDVSRYLQQIGLGQYSQAFVQNDITGLELPYLNDEYLIELGVKSIGHRIKISRFIKSIKNVEPSFPPLKPKVDERDIIHPLPQNVFQELFIQSELNDNKNESNELMKECNVCHRKFNQKVIDYHQSVCQETFNKCKSEFTRRGLSSTDQDIIDLLSGKVPGNAIVLEKCKFCGKKISPKLFEMHQKQCQRKQQENKKKELDKKRENVQSVEQKNDYKEKHNQLIELIKQSKKEGSKTSIPIANDQLNLQLNE